MAGIREIRKAGKSKHQVQIQYTSVSGRAISRTIRPYEIKDGMLFATSNKHGANQICSFKVNRIKSAKPLEKKFKPRWEVKL
jgi:predicted DNA-binding transcriptional regulator YafY